MNLVQLLEITQKLATANHWCALFAPLVPVLSTSSADRGGLLLPRDLKDADNYKWTDAVVWEDTVQAMSVPAPLPVLLQRHRPFVCADIATDANLDQPTREWFQQHWHISAVAIFPLQCRERVVGMFWVGRRDICVFTPDMLHLYEFWAGQLALVIENVLLHSAITNSDGKLQTSADEFAALSVIAASMNQSLKLNDVLNTAFDQILRVLGLDTGVLFLNKANEEVKLVMHRNLNSHALSTTTARNNGAASCAPPPMLLLEISQGVKALCLSMRREGPRAILSVPLLARGKLFGMMDVVTFNHRDFTPQDVRLLSAIGSQVAIAVENAQLYTQVVQAREELTAAYERLKLAQDEMVRQEQLAVLGQWAGCVGHELRNPLAVIGNAIYYLRMQWQDADEEVLDSLQRIDTELRRANKIIADLLDFPRFRPAQRAQTDLSGVVDRAIVRMLDIQEVQVTLDVPLDLPAAYVDAAQIEEVLCNLIGNAIQAMDGRGKLTIKAHTQNEHIEMRVSDTGKGIAPNDAPKIFQPLFTTKPKGVGLGLTLSKSLTEVNGGSLTFESQLGEGATFILRMPVYKETNAHKRKP